MRVYANPQKQWLVAAEVDLKERIKEKAQLEIRIGQLKKTIEGLRLAVGDSDTTVEESLPKLCLRVLSGHFKSVPDIRSDLESIGVAVSGKNPLAILHTTLARLTKKGCVEGQRCNPGSPISYRRARRPQVQA